MNNIELKQFVVIENDWGYASMAIIFAENRSQAREKYIASGKCLREENIKVHNIARNIEQQNDWYWT